MTDGFTVLHNVGLVPPLPGRDLQGDNTDARVLGHLDATSMSDQQRLAASLLGLDASMAAKVQRERTEAASLAAKMAEDSKDKKMCSPRGGGRGLPGGDACAFAHACSRGYDWLTTRAWLMVGAATQVIAVMQSTSVGFLL